MDHDAKYFTTVSLEVNVDKTHPNVPLALDINISLTLSTWHCLQLRKHLRWVTPIQIEISTSTTSLISLSVMQKEISVEEISFLKAQIPYQNEFFKNG